MTPTTTQLIMAGLSLIISIALAACGGFYAATLSCRGRLEQLNKDMAVSSTTMQEKVVPELERCLARLGRIEGTVQGQEARLREVSEVCEALRRSNDIADQARS